MWKVRLICVGRIRERHFAEACEEYRKRLTRFCDFRVIEVPEYTDGEPQKCLEREQTALLRAAEGVCVLFDVGGRQMSSQQFSQWIAARRDSGTPLSLIIGGSYGVSEEVRRRADLRLSCSEMTFPHMLFRVMAEEQLYRAFMIAAGTPYQK